MKIIISPAKRMNMDMDTMPIANLPPLLEKTEVLRKYLKGLDYEQAKDLWRCNDKIARLNYERFKNMDLQKNLTPAILSYEGLQYQIMAPAVFENRQWEYVSHSVRILSGFYGILRPCDGVVPYRLEMQAKICLEGTTDTKSLYDFWGGNIYKELVREDNLIVNLASREYSRAVEPYLEPEIRYITCVFANLVKDCKGRDKLRMKAAEAKMARGAMVRYLADQGQDAPEVIKGFAEQGFLYSEEWSWKISHGEGGFSAGSYLKNNAGEKLIYVFIKKNEGDTEEEEE